MVVHSGRRFAYKDQMIFKLSVFGTSDVETHQAYIKLWPTLWRLKHFKMEAPIREFWADRIVIFKATILLWNFMCQKSKENENEKYMKEILIFSQ